MVMKIFAGHPEPGPGHQDEDFLHVLNSALGGHPHYEAAAGEDGEAEAAANPVPAQAFRCSERRRYDGPDNWFPLSATNHTPAVVCCPEQPRPPRQS